MNETIHSYGYPFTKITICLLILIILFFRNRIFADVSDLLRILMTIIAFLLTICAILAIYVSICEMISIYEKNNERNKQKHPSEYKTADASIDQMMDLLRNNDCMDIMALFDSTIIHIGTASDSKVGSSTFLGKIYYIDDKEFETVESFEEALIRLNNSDKRIKVIEIDGISPLEYSVFR